VRRANESTAANLMRKYNEKIKKGKEWESEQKFFFFFFVDESSMGIAHATLMLEEKRNFIKLNFNN
jgi:hypothetical protein